MFSTFLVPALRHIFRNKAGTIINVVGLAVSIACCIAVYVFIRHEKTFDAHHSKAARTYRIVYDEQQTDYTEHNGSTPFAVATALRNDFAGAEQVTQVYARNYRVISVPGKEGNRLFEDHDITFADPYFLEIFDVPLLAGKRSGLLSGPDEVIISRALALKFFGKTEHYTALLGKTLVIQHAVFRIAAVMEDMPRNSNVFTQIFLPFRAFAKENGQLMENWTDNWSESYTFVTLPPGTDVSACNAALRVMKNKYVGRQKAARQTWHAQPLRDVHSDELYGGTFYATPSVLIFAFVIMGVIVLATACINFINLATAQSLKRAREIGIRKTLGSSRAQIILRFMGETGILVLLSTALALVLASWFLSAFNRYLSFIVDIDLKIDTSVLLFLGVLTLAITLLSGYYPARIMSGYKPVKVLKAASFVPGSGFGGGFSFRKFLIVTQFVVSQLLIVGTIIIAKQMNYFHTRDLGYEKKNVVTVDLPENDAVKRSALRSRLLEIPGVRAVSCSSGPPTSADCGFCEVQRTASSGERKVTFERKYIDPDYLSLYAIDLQAGRNLNESDKVHLSDSVSAYNVLLNRKGAEALGYKNPDQALGQTVRIGKDAARIVGITADFSNTSLQNPVTPCLLFYGTNWVSTASIRFAGDQQTDNTRLIRRAWQSQFPDHIFRSMTLDEYMKKKAFYVIEDLMYQSFRLFAFLAIIIGCMGLYGLIAYLAVQRQKEIGVRKVLGASSARIVRMFMLEFGKLILIAMLVSAPLAWIALSAWLDGFANRISIEPVYLFAGFGLSALIAAVTIGWESVSAALVNPVKSLRSE
ncbi:MAG: ABC transporter permease [Mucilaginibacter polytrichastri]|nr:ABC transporter permease [Mucilaginibacter polytrichastri]